MTKILNDKEEQLDNLNDTLKEKEKQLDLISLTLKEKEKQIQERVAAAREALSGAPPFELAVGGRRFTLPSATIAAYSHSVLAELCNPRRDRLIKHFLILCGGDVCGIRLGLLQLRERSVPPLLQLLQPRQQRLYAPPFRPWPVTSHALLAIGQSSGPV